ncbi:MAG: Cyclic nucleotide-binding domain [Rhodobacteraceae bacterium HLUCCA08]|nr:MAG: Cyclic nucleotide-binding domain [Rhodobacteraceae bacterium HLUCCA08]
MTLEDLFGPAFLSEGYVGHLSYLLLVISMMMRNMLALRLFVIASALVGIVYDWIWLGNPVGVFWEALLLLVTLVQLVLLWHRDRRARFSDEEARMIAAWFRSGSTGQHRLLLDMGRWEDLPAGTTLTRDGERPDFLCYLSDGAARVAIDDQVLAMIGPGHFIGEMSLLDENRASASARLTGPSRMWRIERAKVERLRDTGSALWPVLEAAITLDMRAKIIAGNRRGAGGPSVAAT